MTQLLKQVFIFQAKLADAFPRFLPPLERAHQVLGIRSQQGPREASGSMGRINPSLLYSRHRSKEAVIEGDHQHSSEAIQVLRRCGHQAVHAHHGQALFQSHRPLREVNIICFFFLYLTFNVTLS